MFRIFGKSQAPAAAARPRSAPPVAELLADHLAAAVKLVTMLNQPDARFGITWNITPQGKLIGCNDLAGTGAIIGETDSRFFFAHVSLEGPVIDALTNALQAALGTSVTWQPDRQNEAGATIGARAEVRCQRGDIFLIRAANTMGDPYFVSEKTPGLEVLIDGTFGAGETVDQSDGVPVQPTFHPEAPATPAAPPKSANPFDYDTLMAGAAKPTAAAPDNGTRQDSLRLQAVLAIVAGVTLALKTAPRSTFIEAMREQVLKPRGVNSLGDHTFADADLGIYAGAKGDVLELSFPTGSLANVASQLPSALLFLASPAPQLDAHGAGYQARLTTEAGAEISITVAPDQSPFKDQAGAVLPGARIVLTRLKP